MSTPWILVRKHLLAHWLRSALTVAALVVALFLFCFLLTIVTTLDAAVSEASANRLVIQSAVSLFVELPRDYQAKIQAVDGVEQVTKFQWFGGYYQDISNFFAQFGVDHDVFFEMFARDLQIVEGPADETGEAARPAALAALAADRRACIIGQGLVRDFGWKPGDTIPLTGTIFQKADGSAWEFNVVGVYKPLKGNVDERTIWFRYDYLAETIDSEAATGPPGVGVYELNLEPGADPAVVSMEIDRLFENGPQRTTTSTEAAFQASFASMMGNLPLFLGTIGGAVVFAVFFSVVNTMLMAGRQRMQEAGILKALGYTDGALASLMLAESLVISVLGGLLGVLVTIGLEMPLRAVLGSNIPPYTVERSTILLGLGVALVIGLVAGLGPAIMLARLRPVQALRSEG